MRTEFFKKIFILSISFLTFILIPEISAAQTITGKVVDGRSGQPLEFSNVSLLEVSDSSMVTGTVVDMKGSFRMDAEPGTYILRVGFIGYDDLHTEIKVSARGFDAGTLVLQPVAGQLDEVTVEAAASLFRSEYDRRVFNMEGTTVAEGGTAFAGAGNPSFHSA
jgi:iron complex outermembrane recepter protein